MEGMIVLGVGFAGGFVASIYLWPWVRTKIKGVSDEIVGLENRIKALRTKIGGAS